MKMDKPTVSEQHLVEVLTPVHIGTGFIWYKESGDFLAKGGELHIIDQNAVFEILINDENEDLKQLVDLEPSIEDLMEAAGVKLPGKSYILKSFGSGSLPDKELRPFIKTAFFQPYIPGSSLKGAIRTALFSEQIEQAADSKKQAFNDITTAHKRGKKPPKNPSEKMNAQVFSSAAPHPRENSNYDFLRVLHLGDSHFSTQNLMVADVRWFNLTQRGGAWKKSWKDMGSRRNIDQWRDAHGVFTEALMPGSQTQVAIQWDEFLLSEFPQKEVLHWQDLPDFVGFDKLKVLMNAHALKLLADDIKFFSEYHADEIVAKCKALQKQIEQESDAMFIRLGWGSGWEAMTGDWMTEEEVASVRAAYGNKMGKPGVDIFPKTRRLAVSGGQPCVPFGWIKVYSPAASSGQLAALQASQAAEAALSPLQREIQPELAGDVLKANEKAAKWLAKLEQHSEAEQREIALVLKGFYEQTGKWNSTRARDAKKMQILRDILGE